MTNRADKGGFNDKRGGYQSGSKPVSQLPRSRHETGSNHEKTRRRVTGNAPHWPCIGRLQGG